MSETFFQAPPAQQIFSSAEIFKGITAENSNAKFSEMAQNATFQNLRRIIPVVDSFKPQNKAETDFKKRVLQFVLPFRVAETAAGEGEKYAKFDEKQFAAIYGKYARGENDCYTYVMNVISESAGGLIKEGWKFTNQYPPRRFSSVEEYQQLEAKLAKEKKVTKEPPLVWVIRTNYSKAKGDQFDFVPGDYIMADKSPLGTGHNHWGIFTPEGIIVDRGNKLEVLTLDQFLEKTDKFEVDRLYGGVGYREHYHASTYTAIDQKTNQPKIHYQKEKKTEPQQNQAPSQ